MAKQALILVRDMSGVAALATRLSGEFGYRLLANEPAGAALASAGLPWEAITVSQALDLLEEQPSPVNLLIANVLAVETAGRAFLSWKAALATFDRDIAEAIRRAAWAADRVAYVGSPCEYADLLEELSRNGGQTTQALRARQAARGLRVVSEFDFSVAQYLEIHAREAPDLGALSGYPQAIRFSWPRSQALAEGENRHQRAALYGSFDEHFAQVAGPPLDYEAILNVTRATYLIGEFERPAVAVVQKGRVVAVANPSGDLGAAAVALATRARAPGYWLVANGGLGAEAVGRLAEAGVDGFLLPDLSLAEKAVLTLQAHLRALVSKSGFGYGALQELRSVVGGALAQDKDRAPVNPMEWTALSFAQPHVDDWEPLALGARLIRHLDSCACVCLRDGEVLAMEVARCSQIEAWEGVERQLSAQDRGLALAVYDEPLSGDGLLRRMKAAGIRLALAPAGGSDDQRRAEANELGMAYMTMPRSLRRL